MPSKDKELKSPVENPLLSPVEENMTDKVKMKKELGLLEGVAIILGIILGSGIKEIHFQVPVITPK